VYAKPAIKKISDLKGKTVSIGGGKDITLIYMESFLAAGGLTSKDVDFHYAKATQDRFAALISGGADAAILYPPATFRAAGQGFTYLGEINDHLKGFPFTVWAVNTNWAPRAVPQCWPMSRRMGARSVGCATPTTRTKP
jgi:ABC-type nitrate/sulfonate/bicarbonate transport system substrate-binding protein